MQKWIVYSKRWEYCRSSHCWESPISVGSKCSSLCRVCFPLPSTALQTALEAPLPHAISKQQFLKNAITHFVCQYRAPRLLTKATIWGDHCPNGAVVIWSFESCSRSPQLRSSHHELEGAWALPPAWHLMSAGTSSLHSAKPFLSPCTRWCPDSLHTFPSQTSLHVALSAMQPWTHPLSASGCRAVGHSVHGFTKPRYSQHAKISVKMSVGFTLCSHSVAFSDRLTAGTVCTGEEGEAGALSACSITTLLQWSLFLEHSGPLKCQINP